MPNLISKCSYCGCEYKVQPLPDDYAKNMPSLAGGDVISHGICLECLPKVHKEIDKYLEGKK